VIPLEAVIARHVALQRREHRDVQLGRIALHGREKVVDLPSLSVPVGDDEPVLAQRVERVDFVTRELVQGDAVAAVGSIEECLTLLDALKRDQSPTMFGRVKRALGLASEV